MKPSEKRDACIIALARAYEAGNTAVTSRIENIILTDQVKLPPKLEEVLQAWGTTPIDEPEMFDLIMNQPLEDVKVKAMRELNVDDFSALDVSTLAHRVINRITSKTDEDGKFKTTPALDSMKLPKTSGLREIKQMIVDQADVKDIEQKAFDLVGFSDRNLITAWEQDLVLEILKDFINAVDSDALGGVADRTPFARYLKN